MSDTNDHPRPRRAIVERTQPVEIREVSRGGCRVESGQQLPVGAFGVLAVTIDGQTHAEVFRVARSGASSRYDTRYEAGVEFLPMPADTPSLVEVVAHLDHCQSPRPRTGRRFDDRS
jgi:hypothetical protein